MSLVHQAGAVCAVGELDLHALPLTQKDVLKSQFETVFPAQEVTPASNTVQFILPGNNEYVDLSETYLYINYELRKQDNTPFTADTDAAPINNMLHSIIKDVQVLIGGHKINGSTDTYAHKAYILDLLNNDANEKRTLLAGCTHWRKDDAGSMNERETNSGWVARRTQAALGSQGVYGRLHIDLSTQPKLLPSGTDLRLTLKLHNPDFFTVSGPNVHLKLKVNKIELDVRRVTVHEEVMLTHNKTVLQSSWGPFNYPFTRSEVTTYLIVPGARDHTYNHPSAQIPGRIIIGLLKNTAFNGTKGENPFNFEHFNVSEFTITVNEQKYELKTDFANNDVARAYHQLHTETGLLSCGSTCDITLHEFTHGYTLFAFDLTPDRAPNDTRLNLLKQGRLIINTNFKTPPTVTISVLVCAFYDNLLQLNSDRVPITDYQMA